MVLSDANMANAAHRFPPEKLCKHGVTNPPTFDAKGFLTSTPRRVSKEDHVKKDKLLHYCPGCGSDKAELYQEHTHIFKVICRKCKAYFIVWAKEN
jgi:Zn finger protein HypA/HybF involved in hydrogenase expression